MMDRQHGLVIVECDSCDATISSERGEEFEAFWQRAKDEGWAARKVAGEWLHGCKRCGAPT